MGDDENHGCPPHELTARDATDVQEAFIDASFAPAKRGLKIGKTKRDKGTKIMAVADRRGLPVAVSTRRAPAYLMSL